MLLHRLLFFPVLLLILNLALNREALRSLVADQFQVPQLELIKTNIIIMIKTRYKFDI